MIVRILLLIPLSLFLIGANGSPPTFVLAGQSNMVGLSTMPPVFTSPTPEGLESHTYHLGDYWKLTEDPLHTGTWDDRTSAWPTFAGEWMAVTGMQVNLIATAGGGSCLLVGPPYKPTPPLWDPDAATGLWYRRMLDQVAEANPGSRLRAVLWYQGECEVTHLAKFSSDPYSDYKAALEHLADRIWEDLGVPMVVAPVSLRPPPWPYQPKRQPIHDATIDAAVDHPHIYLGPDTDDLEHEEDGSHIHDVVTLGERWFDSVDLAGLAHEDDSDGDGIPDHQECGDISGDGFVNTVDARLIQRCAVGEDLPGICENPLCDATGEGDCNTIDARLVQRLAVGDLAKKDLQCAERS